MGAPQPQPKKRRGRPRIEGTVACKSLGQVRVTEEALARYEQAARKLDLNTSEWIRTVLDKASQ